MHAMYSDGATLAEVGRRFDLSRQRVQQIFREADLPTRSITETHTLRHERLLERSDEVAAAYAECKDPERVARTLGVPRAFVNEIAAARFPVPRRRPRRRGPAKRKYSIEEMIVFLQEAAGSASGRLGLREYRDYAEGRQTDDGRSWPSIHTYTARFGSWRKALIAAGLPAGRHGPSGAKPRFSAQDCIDALREAAQIHGEPPTIASYDELARASNNRLPSAATITKRFGSWYDALTQAGVDR
jgi:hypothetical protein